MNTGVDQNSNDDFEKPSIDVAGVNLVPGCFSADSLKNSLETTNSQDVYEVNCSVTLSGERCTQSTPAGVVWFERKENISA